MPRALTPTLALLLAAGISVVGPNLLEPEPVAAPWSNTTAATGPRGAGHDSMSSGALAHLTAVRASGMSNSRPAAPRTVLLVATTDHTTTTGNTGDTGDTGAGSTACHAS